MMNSQQILVYSYRRCPFAMRVRIALHEKGIPFEVKEEDLRNFSEELKQLHPEVKVPLLVHGSVVIYESAIITEYVNELAPQSSPLMPGTPGERSEVRLWTYWCNHHLKPAIDRFKYGTARFPESECVGIEEKLKPLLERIETQLKAHSWLVGNAISLADINVFPFVRQLYRIQPTPTLLESFKSLNEWYLRISDRPSVVQALKK